MRLIAWVASSLLAALIIVVSVVGTFHDDCFYRFAYGQNGAYERTDAEMPMLVTENFQSFLDGEEGLLFFQDDQAAHLEDVKGLYAVGVGLVRVLIGALAVLFVMLAYAERKSLGSVFRKAAVVLFIAIAVVGVLSLRWEWFFTRFHELLFSGNWMFHPATLMMRLWGGSFFPLAAAYIVVKVVLSGGFLLCLGRLISRLSASR